VQTRYIVTTLADIGWSHCSRRYNTRYKSLPGPLRGQVGRRVPSHAAIGVAFASNCDNGPARPCPTLFNPPRHESRSVKSIVLALPSGYFGGWRKFAPT